ncbi:MAG: hypothetical protein MI867_09235 [Pseudomonadales bacterium]|nr:hypothetical protein [Pseudomonadales bacterium]
MAISYPRDDLMSAVRLIVQAPGFRLQPLQEISRLRNGEIRAKNFADPIWKATFSTPEMTQDDCVDFESILNDLEDGLKTFQAYDERRPYPFRYQNGTFSDNGQISAISNNGRTVTFSGFQPGFQLTRGDKFRLTSIVGTTLHEIKETISANGSGATSAVEVQPNIPPAYQGSNPVSFKKPYCLMVVEPGSISYNPGASALGTVTFSAVQYL